MHPAPVLWSKRLGQLLIPMENICNGGIEVLKKFLAGCPRVGDYVGKDGGHTALGVHQLLQGLYPKPKLSAVVGLAL